MKEQEEFGLYIITDSGRVFFFSAYDLYSFSELNCDEITYFAELYQFIKEEGFKNN